MVSVISDSIGSGRGENCLASPHMAPAQLVTGGVVYLPSPATTKSRERRSGLGETSRPTAHSLQIPFSRAIV